MPVTLAMAATDRSISAHRITKVRPTAMMPVTEICVRMLPTLSSVAKEGLRPLKKLTRQISVRNGAMLRIWERSIARARAVPIRDVALPSCGLLSRGFQEPVLADRLVRRIPARSRPSSSRGCGRRATARSRARSSTMTASPLVAQALDDVDDVVLGADIHAAGRLAQHQDLAADRSATSPAPPSAGCRPTAMPSSGSTAAGGSDSGSTCRLAIARSRDG